MTQLAKDLHSDLLCIKSGLNEVVSPKQFLAEQFDDLIQALKAAKQTWIEASIRTGQQPSAPPHPHGGPIPLPSFAEIVKADFMMTSGSRAPPKGSECVNLIRVRQSTESCRNQPQSGSQPF